MKLSFQNAILYLFQLSLPKMYLFFDDLQLVSVTNIYRKMKGVNTFSTVVKKYISIGSCSNESKYLAAFWDVVQDRVLQLVWGESKMNTVMHTIVFSPSIMYFQQKHPKCITRCFQLTYEELQYRNVIVAQLYTHIQLIHCCETGSLISGVFCY